MEIAQYIQEKYASLLAWGGFGKPSDDGEATPARRCQFGHEVSPGSRLCSYGHRPA